MKTANNLKRYFEEKQDQSKQYHHTIKNKEPDDWAQLDTYDADYITGSFHILTLREIDADGYSVDGED